ncbi:MAG: ATP-binding protein [Acidobacteriota bacterium]
MRHRMQRNLVLLFLGSSALPLAAVVAIGYLSSTRAVVAIVKRQTEFSCRQVEKRFERRLRWLQDQFLLAARGYGSLPQHWSGRARLRGNRVEFYLDDLLTEVGPDWAFTSVTFVDQTGHPRYKIDYQARVVGHHGQPSYFLQAANFGPEDSAGADATVRLDPTEVRLLLPEAGSGTMVLRMVTPIHCAGERRGAFLADFDASRILESMVSGMSLETDSYFFLVDARTHVVLAHPDFTKRNQLLQVAMPALGGEAFAAEEGGHRYRDRDGREWIFSYRRLRETPWICAVAAPLSPFLSPIHRVGWLSLGLVVLVLSTTTALIFLATRRFRRQLASLTDTAEAFSSGHLERRVDVRSDDEMGALGNTFNRMAARLQHEINRCEQNVRFESFHRLSAALAHDLKGSLFSLSLLTENMDRHMEDPEFLRDSAMTIHQTLEKMMQTSNKLLHHRHRGELKKEPRALTPLVEQAIQASGVGEQPGLQIEKQFDKQVLALVDIGEFRRLLLNLLQNAAAAMPGGGTLHLSCQSRAGKDGMEWAEVVVRDTGTGMTAEFVQKKLFHPFVTTKAHGIGLGLHDCREIVARHQGQIHVQSEPDRGTAFTILLPALEKET